MIYVGALILINQGVNSLPRIAVLPVAQAGVPVQSAAAAARKPRPAPELIAPPTPIRKPAIRNVVR